MLLGILVQQLRLVLSRIEKYGNRRQCIQTRLPKRHTGIAGTSRRLMIFALITPLLFVLKKQTINKLVVGELANHIPEMTRQPLVKPVWFSLLYN